MSKETGFGKLKALSSPEASIFLNNVAIGKTPYEDKLKEGEYLLKYIPDGTASDTASWQGKIKIYKNTLTYVDRELGTSDITSSGVIFSIIKMESPPQNKDTGEIEIRTEPAGATVLLDNDEKGLAPLILTNVPKGDHELSVTSQNFFSRTQKINIDPGFRVIADFKLALDQSKKSIEDLTPTKAATSSASTTSSSKKPTIVVKDTPTGFLRVRTEPTVNASEAAQIKPGETYPLIETAPNWYKIEYEKGKQGWIAQQYAEENQ